MACGRAQACPKQPICGRCHLRALKRDSKIGQQEGTDLNSPHEAAPTNFLKSGSSYKIFKSGSLRHQSIFEYPASTERRNASSASAFIPSSPYVHAALYKISASV